MTQPTPLEQVRLLGEQAGVDIDEVVELWSERAAVREYDGGQSRADAERDAVGDVRRLIGGRRSSLVGERRGPVAADSSGAGGESKRTVRGRCRD